MAINSIKKGKSFERDIVKSLKKLTNKEWYRVPMSGAFGTINKSVKNNSFKADVFCEDELYKDLVIECKATKEIIELTHIFNPKSTLNEFITQAQTESKGKDWLLIVKVNNRKTFFICSRFPEDMQSDNVVMKYNQIFKYSTMTIFDTYILGILCDELRPKNDKNTNEEVPSITEKES